MKIENNLKWQISLIISIISFSVSIFILGNNGGIITNALNTIGTITLIAAIYKYFKK